MATQKMSGAPVMLSVQSHLVAISTEDVWADVRYALDELERPSSDAQRRLLAEAERLDEEAETELYNRLTLSFGSFLVYWKAISRAQARIAHEGIEKGLKAILMGAGWKNTKTHDLHELLGYTQQYCPKAFSELERCFESTVRYLKFTTGIQRSSSILDYFRENGTREKFKAIRYASITGDGTAVGMIGLIHMEVMRALLWLLFDWTPVDIESRIEDAVRAAVSAESGRDVRWDAEGWLGRGPARPRLETAEDPDNRVLRAAVRRCEKSSDDSSVRFWAETIRHNRIAAKKTERAERRLGASREQLGGTGPGFVDRL